MILLLVQLLAAPAMAQADDGIARLHAQDVRLARIADRLMQANAALCVRTMPITGLLLHSRDQYASPPPQWFADGTVAVEAVVPGSPADRAGIEANDAIVAVGDTPVSDMSKQAGDPLRDTAFWKLAAIAGTVHLRIRRAGVDREISFAAPRGCRALVEVVTESGRIAQSDGPIIQISYQLAAQLTDDQLPVTFAHELAHTVLEHHSRLEAAGVKLGLLSEIGRSQQINRTVEVQADRLSVHLLANAGYDPELAVRFWRSKAARLFGPDIMRDWAYPSSGQRAQLMQDEIDRYLTLHKGPDWPGHLLATRDQPL